MNKQTLPHRVICTAVTRLGVPCRSWSVPGTDPPRCASHGGVSGRPGAPPGNQNALTHGLYARHWNRHRIQANPALKKLLGVDQSKSGSQLFSMDERQQYFALIARTMLDKFLALSAYIDSQAEHIPVPALAHLLALFSQMASRLGRLLRDQRFIAPQEDDFISEAIKQAMVELSEILGTDLT